MAEHTDDGMDYIPLSSFTPAEIKESIAYNKNKLDQISEGCKLMEECLAILAEQRFISKEDVAEGREDALTLHYLLVRKKEIEADQRIFEGLDAANVAAAEGKKGDWKTKFGAWVKTKKELEESVAVSEGVVKKEREACIDSKETPRELSINIERTDSQPIVANSPLLNINHLFAPTIPQPAPIATMPKMPKMPLLPEQILGGFDPPQFLQVLREPYRTYRPRDNRPPKTVRFAEDIIAADNIAATKERLDKLRQTAAKLRNSLALHTGAYLCYMQLSRPADSVNLERQLATDFQNALTNVQRTIRELEDSLEVRRKEDEAKVEETKARMEEQMEYLMKQIEDVAAQAEEEPDEKNEESTVEQESRKWWLC